METLDATNKLHSVLDWERATDLGPNPTRDDLQRFFTASEFPPQHDVAIQEYFRQDTLDRRTGDGEGAHIALLRQYYELVRAEPDIYDKRQVINLLARAPEHARQLKDIFMDAPELMRPYARVAPRPPSDPTDDTRLGTSRISHTLSPELIRAHLEYNARLAQKITANYAILKPGDPAYSANNFEKKLRACFDDQVNIWGGVIEKRAGDTWLRLRVSPPNPFVEGRDSWFESYEFSIKLQNGVVDSPPLSHHQFENAGYHLYDASDHGLDEQRLLTLLTEPETSSPDDWDNWAESYLEAQGLFGPKRD